MEYDIKTNTIGTKYYYKKGTYILHRKDGPAIEMANGDKYFYINGDRHREDGPAIERAMLNWFYKEWHINGKLHRENGPAIETSNGYRGWYFNGEHHRIDGPAVEWTDGAIEWWINGNRLSPEKETVLNKWWDNKNGI